MRRSAFWWGFAAMIGRECAKLVIAGLWAIAMVIGAGYVLRHGDQVAGFAQTWSQWLSRALGGL